MQGDGEDTDVPVRSYSALGSCCGWYGKQALKNNPDNYHFRHSAEIQATRFSALSQRGYGDGMKNRISCSVHMSMTGKIWPLNILIITYMNTCLTNLSPAGRAAVLMDPCSAVQWFHTSIRPEGTCRSHYWALRKVTAAFLIIWADLCPFAQSKAEIAFSDASI